MADERNLKDAKIKVKLDLSEARRDLDGLSGGKRDRGGDPGRGPPRPAKEDEKERRRGKRPGKRGPGIGPAGVTGATVIGKGGALNPQRLLNVLLVLAAARATREVAEVVPAMIDEKLDTFEDKDWFWEGVTRIIDFVVGDPLRLLAKTSRATEIGARATAALTGAAGRQAFAQQAAFGFVDEKLVKDAAVQIAIRESGGRALRANVELQQKELMAATLLDSGDTLKEYLMRQAGTNR